MSSKSSQKFFPNNRAPRVQIEYDVETYGSEQKIELPFIMGVMADLAGKSLKEQPPIGERKFLEIDVDNFDDRMSALAPRVSFSVQNTLTGEGSIPVEMEFSSIDDFSPAVVAEKVGGLAELLEARKQLAGLQTYMDGKTGAEDLLAQLLQNPHLLKSLASAPIANQKDDE